MTQRVTGQRFRQRKLSTKQNLPVLRENEVEKLPDDDAQRHIPKVETGVEKGEEIEHHLQAVISASQAAATGGKVAQLYIPTPDAVASSLQYEQLYPRHFAQPATYIRFSSTVEDCVGCPYCMTSEDMLFLKEMNQKKGKTIQCNEDEFEEVMNFFEETAQTKQPYAAVDNPPVLSYEEIETEFDETISESSRRFAKDIYEHWKNQRLLANNRGLMPTLKFETNLETDDSDPYVCFRRREVRQVRKTRGRDAQVTEKLKKLRKELEEARYLMSRVKVREVMGREQLAIDRQIFEQRAAVKEVKRKLSIKGDDEDLINQKPAPKPKPKVDSTAVQRGIPGMGPKPQLTRPDGRLLDSDLVSLQEQLAKKEEAINGFIEENLAKHQKWNHGWEDLTWRPITPPLEQAASRSTFRPVTCQQLPTPPASVSSENSGDNLNADQDMNKAEKQNRVVVRYASPPDDVPYPDQRRYRRRKGRGGRIMVDRRGVKRPCPEPIDERILDRHKYSGDSSEDEQLYFVDPYDNLHIKYRMMIDRQGEKGQGVVQRSIGDSNHLHQNHNHNRSASGHLLPPSNAAG